MLQHKVVNLNDENISINLNNVLVESLEKRDALTFELNDGGEYQLTQSELWTAFNVLSSDEFDILTDYINRREDAFQEASALYANMVKDGNFDANTLYDYGHAMKAYGRFGALADNLKGRLIELVGWSGWVDACRMYESLTKVPREWLS